MSADIIQWPHPTVAPIDPAKVLAAAAENEFETVFVCGFLKDGSTYLASSDGDGGNVMWLMERAKRKMHEYADAEESTP